MQKAKATASTKASSAPGKYRRQYQQNECKRAKIVQPHRHQRQHAAPAMGRMCNVEPLNRHAQ